MSKQEFNNNISDYLNENQKTDLDVLEKDETRREKKWKENVEKAKVLLTKFQNIRQQVAELALEVCVIHHGGRSLNERYSVTNFAKDIGLAHRTLLDWVRLYKNVYPNVPTEMKENITFQELREIDVYLRGTDRKKDVEKNILKAYKNIKSEHHSTRKMRKYLKHLNTILFNVKNPRMIADCDAELLTEMLHTVREIGFLLGKLDKKSKSKRAMPK